MIKLALSSTGDKVQDIKEAMWIINCAMDAIEKTYPKDSVRYKQMESHYEEGLKDLRFQLTSMIPRPKWSEIDNLNWLWPDGQIPEDVEFL